jgi:hypothetical protein
MSQLSINSIELSILLQLPLIKFAIPGTSKSILWFVWKLYPRVDFSNIWIDYSCSERMCVKSVVYSFVENKDVFVTISSYYTKQNCCFDTYPVWSVHLCKSNCSIRYTHTMTFYAAIVVTLMYTWLFCVLPWYIIPSWLLLYRYGVILYSVHKPCQLLEFKSNSLLYIVICMAT